MVAMGVLRVAAYVSSRRIPVYLAISVPAFDPDDDEAFRGLAPVVADSPDRPPAEAVGVLRAYSLAAADERLPPYPDGDAGSRYNYTITVNSVLQEVMRARYGSDPYTPLIIDRLAWHTERWMKAAFELGAHERALALAAHAAAIEEHASRLNLTTDFIAFLRGNLASVEFRQNKEDRVIRLLRSEIELYRGRGEELAQRVISSFRPEGRPLEPRNENGPEGPGERARRILARAESFAALDGTARDVLVAPGGSRSPAARRPRQAERVKRTRRHVSWEKT